MNTDQCEFCGGDKLSSKQLKKNLMELRDRELEWMEEYGFYTHIVPASFNGLNMINAHTHGLPASCGHSNFQIVLPLDSELIQTLLHNLVDRIKDGAIFKAGMVDNKLVKNFNVTFQDAEEGGRNILRIILPDKYGKLLDSTEPFYQEQRSFKDE
jgi:Domain of unknown function (DUF4262)